MKTNRKTALLVGIFFVIGTVAGIMSGVVTAPILGDPDYLVKIAENEPQFASGALLILVMGFPLAMIPVLLFPIFKKYNEVLALGAVIFRGALEAVAYMLMAIGWLLLLSLSKEAVNAGAAEVANFQTMGTMILKTVYWTEHILAIVFSLGALMLYWLFVQSKLIPRWLALWGFIGGILYFAAPVASLFDPQHLALSLDNKWGILIGPLALQEMVMAVWLIVKGFNPAPNEPGSSEETK